MMRDSEEGRTHSYGDGCQPPHDDPDRDRQHAANLRLQAAEIARRYWACRSNHDLSPGECEQLERERLALVDEAEQIEAHLQSTAPSNEGDPS